MNDEIKEIIEMIQELIKEGHDESGDFKKLLDYITNLQEENKKLINENETIKNIKYTIEETIYKQRNEKAIEYIENDMPYLEEPDEDYENNHKMKEYDKSILLNILKGENNE